VTIPIVELGSICVSLQARNDELFTQLGSWVTTTSDPQLQRVWATACHRHAAHAELWAQRTPRIATLDFGAPSVDSSVSSASSNDDAQRRSWYLGQLDEIGAVLERLEVDGDATLDPSTARTVQLVAADVADLRSRLAD
jgi:hypothetical protein